MREPRNLFFEDVSYVGKWRDLVGANPTGA